MGGTQLMAQVAILRFDDVTLDNGVSINAAWKRLTDLLVAKGVNGACGVIGANCQTPNQAAKDWVKSLNDSGVVEWFGHGWVHKCDEFKGRSIQYQAAAMQETARLLRTKFNVPCDTWGAPCIEGDIQTGIAVYEAGVRTWSYGKFDHNLAYARDRGVRYLTQGYGQIEPTTGVCDLSKLQSTFNPVNPYCHPVGHPFMWNDASWAQFELCIDFLKNQGCVFALPRNYTGPM